MSVSDKRRSFPTSFVRIQNDYEQPVKQRAELRQVILDIKKKLVFVHQLALLLEINLEEQIF